MLLVIKFQLVSEELQIRVALSKMFYDLGYQKFF